MLLRRETCKLRIGTLGNLLAPNPALNIVPCAYVRRQKRNAFLRRKNRTPKTEISFLPNSHDGNLPIGVSLFSCGLYRFTVVYATCISHLLCYYSHRMHPPYPPRLHGLPIAPSLTEAPQSMNRRMGGPSVGEGSFTLDFRPVTLK